MGRPAPCPASASCCSKYGSVSTPSPMASRFLPNSSITTSSGRSAARARATSTSAAGDGPVRRGSSAAASSMASRSASAAGNSAAEGTRPKLRTAAACSARRTVRLKGSRSAVTSPRWNPDRPVPCRSWPAAINSAAAGDASAISLRAARLGAESSPQAASRSRASEDLPDPYGPVSDHAPPAGPLAAAPATRSTTSRALAVTTYPSRGSVAAMSRSTLAERANRPATRT